MTRYKDIIIIEVPKYSSEFEIDDFLGNTLQYKIGEKWIYDTLTKLPDDNLEVIGLLENNNIIDLNLDNKKKWLLIKVK